MTDSARAAVAFVVATLLSAAAWAQPWRNYAGNAQHRGAVREWCINTAAVDVRGRCALVNNEDGVLYRWDFATNTLSAKLVLTTGLGEAYTPTVVGPDGTVFAINNAILFARGRPRRR